MPHHHIAVLGPVPRDHITTHRGEVIEKYGCAMHTSVGISRLLEEEGTVHLVSHIRLRDEAPVRTILDRYTNIDTAHLNSGADQGDVIRLEFIDQNQRIEKQTGFMPPILPEDVENLLHCEAFVCVPITDYEVPLQTLKYIRNNSDASIIFDAHGPTNTVSVNGDRMFRYWIDRDQWLPYIDVLKMNLEESHCCWFEKEYDQPDTEGLHGKGRDHLPAFAEHVLAHGVKALIVTLDENGSAIFYREGDSMKKQIMPAIWVENVVDTTGCGDSFAGGLGFGLLQDPNDILTAVRYANALGAQRTQGRTFDVFRSRKETNAMIHEYYGIDLSTEVK